MAEKKTTLTNGEKPVGLQAKLLRLQQSVTGLAKDAHAEAFKNGKGYTYLSGDKLLSAIRPMMDRLGLRLTQEIDTEHVQFSANGAALFPFIFTWIDVDSGERETLRWFAAGSNTPVDKAVGSATTYAERYFIMKQFHLPTDRDDTDALSEDDFKAADNGVSEIEEAAQSPSNFMAEYDAAMKELNAAKNESSVVAVWNSHPSLWGNVDFSRAIATNPYRGK